MKKINTYLIENILLITGMITVISVIIYSCFMAHPLLVVFSIGAWIVFIGAYICNYYDIEK